MDRVAGKVAIVTGGASGIGKAACEALVREGACVIIADINVQDGLVVAGELGGQASFIEHDVASERSWQEVIETTVGRMGHLDVLVNNAGIIPFLPRVEEVSLEQWRRVLSVNLDGTFLGVKHGARAMKASGGGSIINMSSVGGIVGTPHFSAYNVSKAGIRLLTKCAAAEFGLNQYNIRVNSIHPGATDTPPSVDILRQISGGDPERGRQVFLAMHPIGRLGRPEDIAHAVVYLASDESSFMTGSELVIDGGLTAV